MKQTGKMTFNYCKICKKCCRRSGFDAVLISKYDIKRLQKAGKDFKFFKDKDIYVMTFEKDDRDIGRVITGSSNFTQSGLVDNLEFNVELKNPSDYTFAKEKFDELWKKGVDVSAKYIETITEDTWLKEDITPYELYLKFLYEYFKERAECLNRERENKKYLKGYKLNQNILITNKIDVKGIKNGRKVIS